MRETWRWWDHGSNLRHLAHTWVRLTILLLSASPFPISRIKEWRKRKRRSTKGNITSHNKSLFMNEFHEFQNNTPERKRYNIFFSFDWNITLVNLLFSLHFFRKTKVPSKRVKGKKGKSYKSRKKVEKNEKHMPIEKKSENFAGGFCVHHFSKNLCKSLRYSNFWRLLLFYKGPKTFLCDPKLHICTHFFSKNQTTHQNKIFIDV